MSRSKIAVFIDVENLTRWLKEKGWISHFIQAELQTLFTEKRFRYLLQT